MKISNNVILKINIKNSNEKAGRNKIWFASRAEHRKKNGDDINRRKIFSASLAKHGRKERE